MIYKIISIKYFLLFVKMNVVSIDLSLERMINWGIINLNINQCKNF